MLVKDMPSPQHFWYPLQNVIVSNIFLATISHLAAIHILYIICLFLSHFETGLMIQNFVDLAASVMLIYLGFYLYEELGSDFNNPRVAWLGYCCFGLGGLLFLVSMFSFFSICCPMCRCLGAVSEKLASLVAILCLILGITCLIMRKDILDYFDSNADELHLSEDDITFMEDWYDATNIFLLALFILELVRYQASLQYRLTSYRIDGEFKALIDGDEDGLSKDEREVKKQAIRDRYRNTLREAQKKQEMEKAAGNNISNSNRDVIL